MTHSYGFRSGTRKLFRRGVRNHGLTGLSANMIEYKIGDYVHIVVNSSIHDSMPHKYYHGKTGQVFNVGKRTLGVNINKRVRHRIVQKRVIVAVEHVKPARCNQDHLKRVEESIRRQKEATENGTEYVSVKRVHPLPQKGYVLDTSGNEPILLRPIPYECLI